MIDIADNTPDVIYVYTAKDSVADGQAIRLDSRLAADAGYHIPVVMTRAAWSAAVEWERDDGLCDETGRAWDVLNLARWAARSALEDVGRRVRFMVLAIPNRTPAGRPSRSETPRRVTLTATAEGYDLAGQPCIILALPGED